MEQCLPNQEVYDFRQYDRIWQRVAPNLEPYPGMTAGQTASVQQEAPAQQTASVQQTAPIQQTASAGQAASVQAGAAASTAPVPSAPVPAVSAVSAAAASEAAMTPVDQLPGAEKNPCCMGTAAGEMLDVITGYIEAALSDRRYLLALTRQAPVWARQTLRDIASDLQAQARQLLAAHYLITGQCYRPSVSTERIYVGRWCPALRERYHAAACSGFNYARSADDTTDPCLARLLQDLSGQSYAHAEDIMNLLQRSLR